jgi:hypothetical protein
MAKKKMRPINEPFHVEGKSPKITVKHLALCLLLYNHLIFV